MVYNVDFSPVSEEKYKKRETRADILGISGTIKLIRERKEFGGAGKVMTEEEQEKRAIEAFKKYGEDGKKWDARELKDKFTDTNMIYGYIVSAFTNKAAQFDDYAEDRNKAQDAGLTERSKSAEDNFQLPDGWIKEEDSERFYNESLNLYSYRHPSIKVPEKWKSSVTEILGKKYVVFKHKHGFESKFLEKDPELPKILQLELKSIQIEKENIETDYEMLSLQENLKAAGDYTKIVRLPKGWKTVLDSRSPTGVSYVCEKGRNNTLAQRLLTENGSLHDFGDAKLISYRNPSWPIPDGWIQKSKKIHPSEFIIYYKNEKAGLTSYSIETDENIPKELYKSNADI